MIRTLLGIVERLGFGKSGPGARLRPIFETSADKTRWVATGEDFSNSGVVSWWQPLPDAEVYKAWTFQVESSRTYDPENNDHDFYSAVKGSISPAVELIDVQTAADPEDTRAFLLDEGFPFKCCATKRLVFRDRSGQMVGPLELYLREGRLFLDEKEALTALSHSNGDAALATWEGHRFLPLESWLRKVGEVDFSPNMVFLKRVLREIRDIPPTEIDKAKFTERHLGLYSSAFERVSRTPLPLQTQRLKRLHKLRDQAGAGITLAEEAVFDLLDLPIVKDAVSIAKEDAVRRALEERRAAFTQLDKKRTALEEEIGALRIEAAHLRDEISSVRDEQRSVLASFDDRVHKKFEQIGKDASSFLADVALIRAALSTALPPTPSSSSSADFGMTPHSSPLEAMRIVSTFREGFDTAGLGCMLPTALLSSWASGFVPMVFGAMTREALIAASQALFGENIHFSTLGPTLSSPTDLIKLPTTSTFAVSTVGELVRESNRSGDLVLLVFENTNMSQLDSTLVPLLRSYAAFQGEFPSSNSKMTYPTPVGMWPSNLLLGGILIDSSLALPISRELWTSSTFIDASSKRTCVKGRAAEGHTPKRLFHVPYEHWVEWLESVEHTGTSDTRVIAAHAVREVESSSLFKRMLGRLAAAIDHTGGAMSEAKRAGLLTEMTIIPYLLSRGIQPDTLLEDAPADVSPEDGFIETLTRLFHKWGLDVH